MKELLEQYLADKYKLNYVSIIEHGEEFNKYFHVLFYIDSKHDENYKESDVINIKELLEFANDKLKSIS